MTDFQTKKIRPDRVIKTHDNLKKAKKTIITVVKGHIVVALIIALLITLMLTAAAKVTQFTRTLTSGGGVTEALLSIVSSSVEKDDQNNTNFLLLGMGGEGHDGAELTDTIMIASIDHDTDLVPMLSIPRDFFIEDEKIGNWRINRFYELTKLTYENEGLDEDEAKEQALEDMSDKIGEILDIEIHYYALVDFNGFTEVVDAIGGIDVYLEESFYDPYYPVDGTDYYQTFYLPAGDNHLNGENALMYARSRKTTSDFDRAIRQQTIISEIKDKALSLGVLANPGKLKNLYDAFSDNFTTNLTFAEMADLGKMATDFERDSILSQVFSDDPYATGGFLYTPDRNLYDGAFVLVPSAGDYSELQLFSELFLHNPEIYEENIPLQVLNGVSYGGLATDTKTYLERYGFNIARYGNAAEIGHATTSIFNLNQQESETIQALLTMIPTAEIAEEIPEDYWPESWETEATLLIELGEDFIQYYEDNYDSRFYYWQYVPEYEGDDETAEDASALREDFPS